MSNVKRVEIVGEIPFNTGEYHDLNKFLGQMNSPVSGLRVIYGRPSSKQPNAYGGTTQFYHFNVHGEEAVSSKWIEALLQALVNAGSIVKLCSVFDIENREHIRLEIPKDIALEFVAELRVKVTEENLPFESHQVGDWLQRALHLNADGQFPFADDGEFPFEFGKPSITIKSSLVSPA